MLDQKSVKTILADLNTYFIDKILRKEYSVKEMTEFTVTIIIDDYEFCLWIAVGEFNFKCYDYSNTLTLQFNGKVRKQAYDIIYGEWLENKRRILTEKRDALDQQLARL